MSRNSETRRPQAEDQGGAPGPGHSSPAFALRATARQVTHHASRITHPPSRSALRRGKSRITHLAPASAFTLMEVMIAAGIFFMAVFAILALVSNTLRNARGLRQIDVDAGMVAAQLYKTNKLTEGRDSGDFGDLYPDFRWETDSEQIESNGLWQVDIVVTRRGLNKPFDMMSVWMFSPDSKSSFFNGGMTPR